MKTEIIVEGRKIGPSYPVFVIAELSGNHNQSIVRALAIVDAAADAGVDAIKIQTYTADTMTMDLQTDDFSINEAGSLWKGRSLYELYKEAYTPWEWHAKIFEHAKKRGLIAFSSPFDDSAVDFLEELNAPMYKIASFENTNIPLIRKIAKTGKPVIISTGMATAAELDNAVSELRGNGCEQFVLLKCTSTYPATPDNTNLATIPHMHQLVNCQIGLSDHTLGIGVGVASVAYGVTVIEKHFTLNRADGGVDSAFSMEPHEMKLLVEECARAQQAIGEVHYGPTNAENNSLKYRRSLYIVKDIKKGEVITEEHIKAIRPGFGLEPKYKDLIIGKRINRDCERGTPLSWTLLG